ncbi:hypothetical protein D3C72_199630 [compost metagenome]
MNSTQEAPATINLEQVPAEAVPLTTALGRSRGMKAADRYSKLAPAVTGVGSFIEALSVMLIALVIGRVFSPADPLFLASGFPYAWILPVILALRYGTLIGMLSALLMVISWFGLYSGMFVNAALLPELQVFPREFFVGGLLLIFIVGQFGDIWAGRMERAQAVNAYLSDRLATLTKNHFLLKISHERLENDLLTKPTTLRSALLQLRQMTLFTGETKEWLPGSSQLLQFAAHVCQLETAALYEYRDGRLSAKSVAEVGMPFELTRNDPLLEACIEGKTLTHLQTTTVRDGLSSEYVVCVPLLSGADDLVGVLVVKHMPFLSLTKENLQFLLVLAGYYADGTRPVQAANSILAELPNCPQDFALDYVRLARLEQEAGVASTIVALTFGPGDLQETLCSHVRRGIRALDISWRVRADDDTTILMVLMPLTGEDALAGYLLRAEQSLKEQFDLDFGHAHISFQSMRIDGQADSKALKQMLTRVHANG